MVNLTPHKINIADEAGTIVASVPPSGVVARVLTSTSQVDVVLVDKREVEVVSTKFGEIQNLPAPGLETLIVSSLVAQAVAGRPDVVSPDTGPSAVRDGDGRIVAVRRFQRF